MDANIKSLLINLPIPFVDDDEKQAPGGLVSIATYVKSKGFDIKVCDLSGISENDFFEYIGEANIYGIGTYSATYDIAQRLLQRLKNKFPKALYVAGGPHASALPEQVANDFDVVVRGEGEEVFVDIIQNVQAGILPSKIIKAAVIRDLDQLPFPDYEFFCDMERYSRRIDTVPTISIDSSRGCNFKCRFCNSIVNERGYWRSRSPENVFAEVKHHYDRGWRAFRFNDDNFLADINRAQKICELLKPLGVKFRIFARAESLSYDLCERLHSAGCFHISVGIESLSPSILACMGKATSVDRIKVGLNNAYQWGIRTRGYFIVGFPGETDLTISETISELEGLKLHEATVYPCIAYPGTDLFDRPQHYDITWIDDNFSNYIQVGKEKSAGFVIRTKTFGSKEIVSWRLQLMGALKKNGIYWHDENKEVI